MLQKLKNKQGFTLIEIVIVLSIAALIMIIVFFAVAGAQRSRRDQQRKALAARIVSQLDVWQSNNTYRHFPSVTEFGTTFWNNYMGNTPNDPGQLEPYPNSPGSMEGFYDLDTSKNVPICNARYAGKIVYRASYPSLSKKNVSICLESGGWWTVPEE
jgi:prepilin-type N-terminal cleavage/methylation domain-containing protein